MSWMIVSQAAGNARSVVQAAIFGVSGAVGSGRSVNEIRDLSQEFVLAASLGSGAMLAIHTLGHHSSSRAPRKCR